MRWQCLMTMLAFYLLICPVSLADAGSMTLEEMISASSTIVLGKVNKVTVINPSAEYPIKIAEVGVIEVFKGDNKLRTIYYWASPGRACDVTNAAEDKISLFMLRPGTKFREYPKSLSALLPRIKAVTSNKELFKIIHQGRGRMVINKLADTDYVLGDKDGGDVIFPKSLEMSDYPDPQYSYVGMIKLDELIAFIKNFLRK